MQYFDLYYISCNTIESLNHFAKQQSIGVLEIHNFDFFYKNSKLVVIVGQLFTCHQQENDPPEKKVHCGL